MYREEVEYMMGSPEKSAKMLGIVLLLVGVLGFIPGITSNGVLLGIFDADPLQNVVHIVAGALLVWVAKAGTAKVMNMVKVLAVVYSVATVLGFVTGYGLLVAMPTTMADNVLHLVVAALLLWMWFGKKDNAMSSSMPPSTGSGQAM